MQPQDPTNGATNWGAPPPPGTPLPPPPPNWGAGAPQAAVTRIATPGRRIGGALLDSMITGFIGTLLPTPFKITKIGQPDFVNGNIDYAYDGFGKYVAASVILGVVIALLNDVVLVAATGASIGKRIVGMRIVNAADGSPVNSGVAFKRLLLDLIGVPAVFLLRASEVGLGAFFIFVIGLVVLAIINLVLLFSDDRNQTLNDKISNTVVVTNK